MRNIFFVLFFVLSILRTVCSVQAEETIQIASLPELSLNTLGLQEGQPYLWQQTDPENLKQRLDQVGQQFWLPAQADILKNLLITDTTQEAPVSLERGTVFLQLRLNTLIKLGFFEEAFHLAELVPEHMREPALQKILFWSAFFQGRYQQACSFIDLSDFEEDTEKLRVLCFLAQDQQAKAALAYDIYKESNRVEDELFDALGNSVFLGLPFKIKEFSVLAPQHLFLLPYVPEALKMLALDDKPLWILSGIAMNSAYPITFRIKAAEKAGLTDLLKELYQESSRLDPNQYEVSKRAVIYEKLKTEEHKADAAAEFMKSAQEDHVAIQLAPLILPYLNIISPQELAPEHISNGVCAYAVHGEVTSALQWYEALIQRTEPEAQKERVELAPLVNKLGGGQPSLAKIDLLCAKGSEERCMRLLERMPEYFTIDNPFFQKISTDHIQIFPPILVGQIKRQIEQNQIGLAVINGLLLLSQTTHFNAPLLDAMRSALPFGAVQRLEVERLCQK